MKKAVVLMSGGVDSAYSAFLLKEQGFDVLGMYLLLHDKKEKNDINISNVNKISKILGIKSEIIDAQAIFKEKIYDYFVESYKNGITPNPCTLCNPYLKFGLGFESANKDGYEFIATGHYAQSDGTYIKEAVDSTKDQSYFLFAIKKEIIPKIIFPLGDKLKVDIKPLALSKLPLLGSLESYKESQEICFVETNYVEVLRKHLNVDNKGAVLNKEGKIIGEHNGYMQYTIGKRKGFTIQATEPHYVLSIDSTSNTITVGLKEDLLVNTIIARNENLPRNLKKKCYIKARYRSHKIEANIEVVDSKIYAKLASPLYGVAEGQSLVVYDGNKVLGGGFIEFMPQK